MPGTNEIAAMDRSEASPKPIAETSKNNSPRDAIRTQRLVGQSQDRLRQVAYGLSLSLARTPIPEGGARNPFRAAECESAAA